MTRTIVEERTSNVVVMDVFSKLIQERIIFIDDIIDDDLANGVIAQLLYLNSLDSKKQINIYINSPGGNILSGLAIYDISKLITAPIRTICIGTAASMGAILMLMGTERCALKHSMIMIHEAQGYAVGKTKDVNVQFKLQKDLEKRIYTIIKENTKIENVEEVCKLDTWYTSEDALKIGFINKIL